MSGFQTLADRMRARGLTRPSSASSDDTNPLTAPNAHRTSQASQATSQSSTSHGAGASASPRQHPRHHSSRITATTDPATRAAFTATPRIPSSDPARHAAHTQLATEQRRVRELEATVDAQRRTIRALNDRVDAQGRENANSAIAARALYGELEAQARWVDGLLVEVRDQRHNSRGILRKFGGLRRGGGGELMEGDGEGEEEGR